jgi:hypothetical protein
MFDIYTDFKVDITKSQIRLLQPGGTEFAQKLPKASAIFIRKVRFV